jgi:hypothetical protein
MKTMKIATIIGAFAFALSTLNAGENLLKNSELKISEGAKLPQFWEGGGKTTMSNVTDNLPAGASNALKIKINAIDQYDGYILQKVKLTKPNMQLKLSAMVKGSIDQIAHIQIKLRKNGKTFKRITEKGSGKAWALMQKSFSTFDADALQVLCRFKLDEASIGKFVWFSKVKLEKATP